MRDLARLDLDYLRLLTIVEGPVKIGQKRAVIAHKKELFVGKKELFQ